MVKKSLTAHVVQPVQPDPPHYAYFATTHAPLVGVAVDKVVPTFEVGVEAGMVGLLVFTVPVAAAPEHGLPADLVFPPL